MGIVLGGGISYGQHAAIPHPSSFLSFATLEVVADVVVSGAAVTSISVTDLDLDADKFYILLFAGTNPAAVCQLSLHYNNDLVAANYYSQRLTVSGAVVASARVNTALCSYIANGRETVFFAVISRPASGKVHAFFQSSNDEQAALDGYTFWHDWVTEANVTRIDLVSNIANSIGIGSRLIVMKVSA